MIGTVRRAADGITRWDSRRFVTGQIVITLMTLVSGVGGQRGCRFRLRSASHPRCRGCCIPCNGSARARLRVSAPFACHRQSEQLSAAEPCLHATRRLSTRIPSARGTLALTRCSAPTPPRGGPARGAKLAAHLRARGGVMSEVLLNAAGRRRSPATMPGFHAGHRATKASATPRIRRPSRRSSP